MMSRFENLKIIHTITHSLNQKITITHSLNQKFNN